MPFRKPTTRRLVLTSVTFLNIAAGSHSPHRPPPTRRSSRISRCEMMLFEISEFMPRTREARADTTTTQLPLRPLPSAHSPKVVEHLLPTSTNPGTTCSTFSPRCIRIHRMRISADYLGGGADNGAVIDELNTSSKRWDMDWWMLRFC
ncbi:hypothetical protein BDP27DRAFT_433585 [Rhodocollybia butyracea]|uniref:Secreted protein n=1 Tax=Rhodocollybia butyracea TaxID=206335 RepID=A0A9P5PDE1_9AGAR|nr:hypothetical protein BDP27DRAFT_433585 [Rhodocollybia butyracea]